MPVWECSVSRPNSSTEDLSCLSFEENISFKSISVCIVSLASLRNTDVYDRNILDSFLMNFVDKLRQVFEVIIVVVCEVFIVLEIVDVSPLVVQRQIIC